MMLAATEYGVLVHAVDKTAMFVSGVARCGKRTKLFVPPEPWMKRCPLCAKASKPKA
jgi:hypothetical protein